MRVFRVFLAAPDYPLDAADKIGYTEREDKKRGGDHAVKDLYAAARRLYDTCFPGEDPAFTDRLFALAFPAYLEGLSARGELLSMLFALPYPLFTREGVQEARYLYAVATDPRYRGCGYATTLLSQIAAEGKPVFLRPSSPALFDFYKKAGFSPISSYREISGKAEGAPEGVTALSPDGYLAARDALLSPPYCRMTREFLSLCFSAAPDMRGAASAAAVGAAGRFAALYERAGDAVHFKEWCGDPSEAPRAAAFLGAKTFTARVPDKSGAPFGVGVGIPEDAVFLAALD